MDEIEQLVATGIFAENERFELVGGEIVPMSPKGIWHEEVKRQLNLFWAKALPAGTAMVPETTLRIGPYEFREPDFIFWPASVPLKELSPAIALLIVEVADSSLGYDLGRKAAYYASVGIPDYWVIDAKRLVTTIHRDPSADGYRSVAQHAGDALLTPLHVAALAVRLTDLGLEPFSG